MSASQRKSHAPATTHGPDPAEEKLGNVVLHAIGVVGPKLQSVCETSLGLGCWPERLLILSHPSACVGGERL